MTHSRGGRRSARDRLQVLHLTDKKVRTVPAPRDFPYIWATWLPRLLTGERNCEWAIWFKARHQGWTRKPSDFNQADWLSRHTELLNEQRDLWKQRGLDVRVEAQNAFQLRGHSATLAGKPDLIVLQTDRILVVDVKTGQAQPWHRYQLMIYMYALPRAMPEYRDANLAGEIIYSDHTTIVPQGGIDQGFVRNLGALIRRIAAPEPPVRVSSAQECRFCDITLQDCSDRIDPIDPPSEPATDDF